MKMLIVYSSRTGNTKKVGEAIRDALPGETVFLPVDQAPEDIQSYDLIFVGFWADRGSADEQTAQFLAGLHHARVALFATAGVYPDSDHARQCLDNAAGLLPPDNQVAGRYICQGRVDPEVVKRVAARFPAGHPHSMTPERKARLAEASRHPNEEDFQKARQFALRTAADAEGK